MKTNMMFLAVVALALTSCATMQTPTSSVGYKQVVVAPKNTTVSEKPTYSCNNGGGVSIFNTKEQCESALVSGNCSYYSPKFVKASNTPYNKKTLVEAPLEGNACIAMDTPGNVGEKNAKHVPLPAGEQILYLRDSEGRPATPHSLKSCRNKFYGPLIYPSVKEVKTAKALHQCLEEPGGVAGHNGKGQTTCSYPIAFSEEPWYKAAWVPYAVGAVLVGGLVAGLVFGLDGHHAASTLLGPGVTTNPAGPGVTTGF